MTDTDGTGATTPHPPAAPHVAGHTEPAGGASRRWFLAGGVALVLGAAAGVVGELVLDRDARREPPKPPPAALMAAVAAERALIADLDATTGGRPAVRAAIAQIRAGHAAHLRALRGQLATYVSRSPSTSSPATSALRGTPRTAAQLRAAERRASAAAARRAATLDGHVAVVLASIAACEATHAELL